MKSISDALGKIEKVKRPKNISTEFQLYGVYLGEQLEDTKHYSLYIKLAKTYSRGLLDEALTYTRAYKNPKSKPKLFMWKLKQLKTPSNN